MKKLAVLVVVLIMASTSNLLAYEDCSKIKNGDVTDSLLWNDNGIARQNCRVANALEMILEEMRKK